MEAFLKMDAEAFAENFRLKEYSSLEILCAIRTPFNAANWILPVDSERSQEEGDCGDRRGEEKTNILPSI